MDPLFQPTAPDDCVACHQADYQREHAGTGYPNTCLTCHTATTWSGAEADHVALSGGFSLVGNHNVLDCASCHILPGMQPIFTPSDPEDCLACHLGDFQREHAGSGYPGTCLDLSHRHHLAGRPVQPRRDLLPHLLWEHQGKWNTCSDCHTSPTDYRVFSCITCHEHRKSEVDKDHSGVSGYVYESSMCLSCHPTGNS